MACGQSALIGGIFVFSIEVLANLLRSEKISKQKSLTDSLFKKVQKVTSRKLLVMKKNQDHRGAVN